MPGARRAVRPPRRIEELETGQQPAALLETIECSSETARAQIGNYLKRYAQDARRLPLQDIAGAVDSPGVDPLAIARRLGVELPVVIRRLATMPATGPQWEIGYVACDGSGSLTFRKPVPGFPMPRHGAACSLWPLYRALMQPSVPIRMRLKQAGHLPRPFVALAHAHVGLIGPVDGPLVAEAQMLLVPDEKPAGGQSGPVIEAGQSCRVCPLANCPARREPSILKR